MLEKLILIKPNFRRKIKFFPLHTGRLKLGTIQD